MIIDILLRVRQLYIGSITLTKSIVIGGFVEECHILCRTNILREYLGKVPTGVGIGLNLQAVHLATLGGNQDGALGTLGAIEHDSLCALQEGNLLNLRRKYVVRRTLHTVDDYKRHIVVVVIIQTVVVHSPKVVAVPSADKAIHVFQTTLCIVLLRQLFHIDIGNTSEKMVGIYVAECNMDFLFHHCRVSVVSGLGTSRQWRYCHHGQKKYVCFYMFHNLQLSNRFFSTLCTFRSKNYQFSIAYHPGFCLKPSYR